MKKLFMLTFVTILSVLFIQQLSLNTINAQTKNSPTPNIIRRSEGVLRGSALSKALPEYPVAAKEAQVEGDVIVEITINEEGKVSYARTISGHELLLDAALIAAKQWTFNPTKLNDNPIKVSGMLTFRFKLGSVADALATANADNSTAIASSVSSQTDDKIIRRSEGVIRGYAVNRVAPQYPAAAKQAQVEGDVVVEITIDEEGKVISANATSGHELLNDVAVTAAKGWTFKPTLIDDKPVKVSGHLTFRFKLGSLPESIASKVDAPPPSIIRRSERVLRGNALNTVAPQYPVAAKEAQVEGDVVVEITIDEQGKVSVARVVSGHELLQASAIVAAKEWTFNPTLLNDVAVKVSGLITFRFKLDNK